jgi:4-hydroxy-4-methyl-2-oxoglutarate aldolase
MWSMLWAGAADWITGSSRFRPQNTPLLGVAMTCHCGPADNLALFGALATAQAGDILVAATDAFTATSVTGDLLLGMAKNRGLLGLVTDGLVRDLAGVLGVGLPVYCAGVTPNSPARNGPGTVGHNVHDGWDDDRAGRHRDRRQ